jgi:hypothetical protein
MSHAILTVNGHTKLDANLDDWQQRPPEQLAELMAATETHFQPELVAAMLAISQAAVQHHNVQIDVENHSRGWTIKVLHT